MSGTTLDKWKERAARAEENRAAMPIVREWIDDARAHLGDSPRVVYAKENGREIGTPGDEGVVPVVVPKKAGRA